MKPTDEKKNPVLTTATGAPIGMQQALTAGPQGPVLMQDVQLLQQMQHFNRERIPERVVHAKGSGAYGTLTITHWDVSVQRDEMRGFINYQLRLANLPGMGSVGTKLANVTRLAPP